MLRPIDVLLWLREQRGADAGGVARGACHA
jgi:hypothetical protein